MNDMTRDPIRAAFEAAENVAGPGIGDDEAFGGGGLKDVPPQDEPFEPPEVEASGYPLNDYGNGQRLVKYYGTDFLFVPRLGWFRWDGTRWASDEDEIQVRRDAQNVAARILGEVEFLSLSQGQIAKLDEWASFEDEYIDLKAIPAKEHSDPQKDRFRELCRLRDDADLIQKFLRDMKTTHRGHAKTSGNSNRISNMLAEAKTAVTRSVSDLNADPLMVNCENGLLRFSLVDDPHGSAWGEGGKLAQVDVLPHKREHLITKMVAAPYDAQASCPVWLKCLEDVQPDPEDRAFLQRWFGYSLTGLTTEQKLAFFFGGGRNGKSTIVDVIARIMADYSTTIPIETLTGSEQRKGSDATPDLVRLPGARFVRASEPDQGQKMKEALIKSMTGGEPIMIRRMMQEFVEVMPEFKLTISGNHKPEVRGSDDGIWRRIMLVHFAQQIAAADVDPELPQKLWAERAGILAWMVQGCLDYLQGGLRPPQSVIEATEDYRNDSDPLRLFLMEECEITGDAGDWERSRDLVDAYAAWQYMSGDKPWSHRAIAKGISARASNVKGSTGHVFIPKKRSDSGYLGIKITQKALDRIAAHSKALRDKRGMGDDQ